MKKSISDWVELPGSARQAPVARNTGAAAGNEIIDVTVRIRRKSSINNLVKNIAAGKAKPISREDFDRRFGATPADLRAVETYAQTHDLTVVQSSVGRRSVILRGSVQHFTNAFSVQLANFIPGDGVPFRGRTGNIKIPAALEGIVEGVFGLDNRPQARPMFHLLKKQGMVMQPRADANSYYANEVAKKYKYPSDVTGDGQCIALIELGGGYRAADMQAYFSKIRIPLPVIQSQSVDGGLNSPSTADSADGEVALDIQVAGSVAPGAKIVVYFTPNTDQGFLDAITTALHDTVNKPSVISISWGAAESQWTSQALQNFNQTFMSAVALGVTITVAAGDNGSSDRETDGLAHVDFPASSPYALACGGTKLLKTSETVWNDGDGWATGGGISAVFPVPDYQQKVSLPASVNAAPKKGRGVPDVAANADSATGYNVLVDGQWTVVGGTSAVAPLLAGFVALANQKLKKKTGFLQPALYAADAAAFNDITAGNNITAKAGGYTAGKGWDACTGLGVPLGALISEL